MEQLNRILKRLPAPEKTGEEWDRAEENLFSELDRRKKRRLITGLSWKACAAAAVLVLILINPAYISIQDKPTEKMAELSQSNTLENKNIKGFTRTGDISSGKIYSTDADNSLFLKIEKGSGLVLYPGSRLHILKRSEEGISMFIEKGRILASISEKERDSSIVFFTENTRSVITGTVLSIYKGRKHTTLSVIEGSVNYSLNSAGGAEKDVTAGASCRAEKDSLYCTNGTDSIDHIDLTMLRQGIETEDKSCGFLRITSSPENASILINGTQAGNTPLIIPAESRKQKLTIRKEGFSSWCDSIDLKENEIVSVSPDLTPLNKAETTVASKTGGKRVSDAPDNKNRFKNSPEYIEAKVQMIMGFYSKALSLLEQIYNNPETPLSHKKSIIEDINMCYQGMGEYSERLADISKNMQEPGADKPNLLWQSAIIKGKCAGDFRGAVSDLEKYLKSQECIECKERALKMLSEHLFFTGEYKRAAEIALKGIDEYPGNTDFLYYYMHINRKYLDKPEQAINAAQGISEPRITLELAKSYTVLKKNAKADSLYRDYLDNNPEGYFSREVSDVING